MSRTQTSNIPHILKFKDIQSRKRAHIQRPSVKLKASAAYVLTVKLKRQKEKYWIARDIPNPFLTDGGKPLTTRQLVRFFRRNCDDYEIMLPSGLFYNSAIEKAEKRAEREERERAAHAK